MRPVQNWPAAFRHSAVRRPQRPHHQQAPQRQTDEEADLPEAAELDVGEALVAEPEPVLVDHPHDAEIIADQRAGDDQQRHPEQEIDQEMLALGLLAAGDGGREKQRRADPRKPDPDDRRLDMDVAQEVEGQEVVDRDAVEAGPVVIGMRHDDAGAGSAPAAAPRPRENICRSASGSASAAGTSPAPGPSARRRDCSGRTRR